MKFDKSSLRPIDLNDHKVKDPIRYPKVIVPIENSAKILFVNELGNMVKTLTEEMVKIRKEK